MKRGGGRDSDNDSSSGSSSESGNKRSRIIKSRVHQMLDRLIALAPHMDDQDIAQLEKLYQQVWTKTQSLFERLPFLVKLEILSSLDYNQRGRFCSTSSTLHDFCKDAFSTMVNREIDKMNNTTLGNEYDAAVVIAHPDSFTVVGKKLYRDSIEEDSEVFLEHNEYSFSAFLESALKNYGKDTRFDVYFKSVDLSSPSPVARGVRIDSKAITDTGIKFEVNPEGDLLIDLAPDDDFTREELQPLRRAVKRVVETTQVGSMQEAAELEEWLKDYEAGTFFELPPSLEKLRENVLKRLGMFIPIHQPTQPNQPMDDNF